MSKVTIIDNHLQRDNKPFFWLADTIWTAFTNPTDEEWLEYLNLRASQGFNVLQINALPQWDRSGAVHSRYPFPTHDDGKTFDFTTFDESYWKHAAWQLSKAVKHGFTPAIVVQWSNYVPNTWASNLIAENVISDELVEPIVRKICSTFNQFDPVYIISGDTDFDSQEPIDRYITITKQVKALAPESLICYHIKGRYDVLPDNLAHEANFYLYQSGHNISAQDGAHTLALSFTNRPEAKPIINSEPCYEQIGYSHMIYGRFRQPDCRRALWLSLTGGASAGITYGAHGVWNWQNPKAPQPMALGEGFLAAMPHTEAIHFPGALDFCFAKEIVSKYDLFELVNDQSILSSHQEDLFAAHTSNVKKQKWVIYVPTNVSFALKGDWTEKDITCVDLSSKKSWKIDTKFNSEKNETSIEQQVLLEDAVFLIQ